MLRRIAVCAALCLLAPGLSLSQVGGPREREGIQGGLTGTLVTGDQRIAARLGGARAVEFLFFLEGDPDRPIILGVDEGSGERAFGPDCEDPCVVTDEFADIEGRSLSRALTRLRGVVLFADVSDAEARLTVHTRASDAGDARILADELSSFVASAGAGAPENVRPALGRVDVARDEAEVRFTIPLDGAALESIRASRTGRNLLTWRLGAEGREQTGRVGAVVEALGIGEGSRVADVGAGAGFFTVRLARAVGPHGHVLAVDIQQNVVEGLRQRAKRAELGNIEAILGAPDDTCLPQATLDGLLIVNAYHEMKDFESMLAHIRQSLKPGGRFVLVKLSTRRREAIQGRCRSKNTRLRPRCSRRSWARTDSTSSRESTRSLRAKGRAARIR